MTEHRKDSEEKRTGVNPKYALFQIARALTTSEAHDDPAVRERARRKIDTWEGILRNILTGDIEYGSRKPVRDLPVWATPEVVTGGFATGAPLAGGPLRDHERKLLGNFPEIPKTEERRLLNAYFLSEAGLADLRDRLRTGRYDVTVPEEGALLVVAWLAENGHAADARALLDEISPYFPKLRFYPVPLDRPRRFGAQVHLQNVAETIENLRKIRPNRRILAQKEAVGVWAPFHDRVVSLFLETVADGWPCQTYPEGWPERALALLGEYAELRLEHTLCGKPNKPKGHQARLRGLLGKCARNPAALTGREVGQIRLILDGYIAKRGAPGSPSCGAARREQAAHVAAPTFHEIAKVVIPRLEKHPADEGLDDVDPLKAPVTRTEADGTPVPEGTAVPPSIRRKLDRCLNETVEILVERGLITSGETLARVLPQMTSGIRAASIADPLLRRLYAAVYRAFRRRRSLLLFNLESQVRMEELPWVAAVDRFRSGGLSHQDLARQTLEEVAVLALAAFPQTILPNKLLQELRALADGAGLSIPLVDELAADIFMGEFSGKFLESARLAADLLEGTLYAAYYAIDYRSVREIPQTRQSARRSWFQRRTTPVADRFALLCADRAGVRLGTWDPATNGMIIEQQQILTTQNLAALVAGLDLTGSLGDRLGEMAETCFQWICRRLQMRTDRRHARLIMVKKAAYAWRQMVFFLSLLPEGGVADFLQWAQVNLEDQPAGFRHRFRPVLRGLSLAAQGRAIGGGPAGNPEARRFLGWTVGGHWD